MKKRILSLALTLCLLPTLLPTAAWEAEQPMDSETSGYSEAVEAPPEATAQPEAPAETPEATAQPTAPAETPEVTAQPEPPAETPETTAQPEAPTETPEATAQPTAPAEPPEVTAQPEAPTETPEVTAQPTAPAEPPEATAQPTAPAKPPEVTAQPTAPAQPPEATVQPTAPAKPPEATAQPTAPAQPPEATAQPTAPAQPPEATVQPMVDENLRIEVVEPDEALQDAGCSVVLTIPGEWDSYDWQLWAGEEDGWTSLDAGDPALPLPKEMFISFAFRCVVEKDGESVASAPYAYDEAALTAPLGAGVNLLAWGEAPFETTWKETANIAVAPGGCFDVYGRENGGYYKTTYSNGGYTIASQVDGTKLRWNAEPNQDVSMGESLTGRFAYDIVYGGRYVKITYTVKNNGSTEKTFKIGSSGDVMIDQNDRAEVVGTPMGLQMDDQAGKTFNLVVPTATTRWFGFFGDAYKNMYTVMSEGDLAKPYSGDSGMAWSWTGTVKPGRTWIRYALVGVGEMPQPLPDPTISLRLNSGKDYVIPEEAFTVSGTATAGSKVYIDVSGQEFEASVAANGGFSQPVTVPEGAPEGPLEIQAWAVNDTTGAMSDTASATVNVRTPPTLALTATTTSVVEEESLNESWYAGFVQSVHGTVTHTTIATDTLGDKTVTYTASLEPFPSVCKTLTVHILPKPAELSQATATQSGKRFTLKSAMRYTGGLTYTETGFVYGSFQNPNLDFYDGKEVSSPKANAKGAQFSATVSGLTDNTVYYARAYAKASDGTVIYGPQSAGFGLGVPSYGTFKIKNNGSATFTIYREGGNDGEQKVYYRTVNGSAVGKWNGDDYNFRHTDGVLTFADGEDEKTVTVKEFSNHAIYNGYVGTQYANADRTYQMEIHRVEGGATIGTRFATRNMGHDSGYAVRKSLYSSENQRSVSTSNDNNYVADRAKQQNGKDSGWEMPFFINERKKNQSHGCVNFNVQREIDVGSANENAYFKATATGFSYKLQLHSVENENGYANIWISNHQPNSMWGTKDHGKSASIDLDYADFGHAFYTGRWEPGGHGNGEETVSYPSGSGATWPQSAKDSSRVSGDWVLFNPDETAQVWFTATGNKTNIWHATWYKDWLKLRDTQEPRVIDVSYMARDTATCTYRPGDPITISLIFDEIVDSQNSSLTSSSSIYVTGWGTFKYAGGADTNVLYFTGTTPDDPPTGGSNIVIRLDCADQIKDMCSTNGSKSSIIGYDSSTAPVAENPKPTVSVGSISNASGTLSAKITASNADRLEYAWTNSSTTPTSGWRRLNNKSGETVTTRQSSGNWYLHARATNADGKKATDYEGVSIPSSGSGALVLPTLTAEVNNANWAKQRTITLTKTPSGASVACTGKPSGATATASGNNFVVDRNGTYTFKLTSNGETATAMATVSKLDCTAPTLSIDTLPASSYVEPVTLTVRAADSESGLSGVTGTWSNGSKTVTAAFTVSNGVYTTTSPGETGAWKLNVTAKDKVGWTTAKTSDTYNLNLNVPTVTVTKGSTNANGSVNYTYSVNMNGQTVQTVQLPDGAVTTALTGSFTLTEAGTYYVVVTDTAGHLARSAAMTVTNSGSNPADGQPPEVRLCQNTEDWVNATTGVTITVSAYDNIVPTSATWKLKDGSGSATTIDPFNTDTAAGVGDKAKTGSFKVTSNGTYTVTVSDARNNTSSTEIEITNIDGTAPTISAPSGNPTNWTANNATISFNVTDTQSGVKTVTAKKGSTNVTVSGSGPYRFTATANGDYVITVTDNVGNTSTKTVNVTKIDKTPPTISVTGGTTAAASLNLTVNAANSGGSGVSTTVSKDGGAAQKVTGGKYTVTGKGQYVFTAKTGAGKTASKTVNVYNVAFAETGNSAVPGQIVVNGGKVTQPTVSKTGYTLSGWKNGTTPWNFGTSTVTANTTLTAQWTLNAPTVELTADKTDATYTGSTVITLTATPTHAVADLTYTYQWYKKGSGSTFTLLTGKTGSTLELTTVADSGDYKVKVTASDGALNSVKESAAKTVTIRKATPTLSGLGATAITYGDALSASTPSGTAKHPTTNAAVAGAWKWTSATANATYPTVVDDSGKTAYTVTFTPTDGANYNSNTATVKLTVNKAPLTPGVNTVANKVYDGKTEATGTVKLVGAKFNEKPAATGTFNFNSPNVTQANAVNVTGITLTGNWGGNYVLGSTTLSNVTTTARITRKEVTLTWAGYTDLTYTGSPVNVTATAGSLVEGDTCTVTVDEGGRATTAGNHTATATALSNSNYQLPAVRTRAYSIAKATPALSGLGATAITYGDALSASTPSGTAKHLTTNAAVPGTWKWTSDTANTTYPTVVDDSGKTAYSVTFTPTDGANYNSNTATVKLTVNKATLTPGVNTVANKVYDGKTDATGTVKLTGAKFNEKPTATGTFAFNSANVTQANAVNVTGIALTGNWDGNYVLGSTALSNVTTTARIARKEVTLTWAGDQDLVYNGSSVDVTATAGSLVEGDTCTVTVEGGKETNAGNHTATATALSNSNYMLPEVTTKAYTIAKATPALSALSATDITYGDALSVSTPDGTAQHPTTHVDVPGRWSWTASDADDIYPSVVDDSDSTEYNVTFTPTDGSNYNTNTADVTLTVNKATLTPSVNTVAGKVYDGSTSTTGTVKLAGAKFSQTPAATGTFNFNSPNVTEANAVNVTGITLTGDWGDNYVLGSTALSNVTTTARITPKEVTLTWAGHENLVYDREQVSVTATAGELVPGDSCDVEVENGTQTNAGTYTATATALSNPNYKLPEVVTQDYTIAKCPVTFTVTHNDVDYHHGGHPKADVTAPSLTKDTEFTVSYRQTGQVIEPHFSGTYDIMVQLTDDNFKFEGRDDGLRELKVGDLTIHHISYEGAIIWPTASNPITYGQPLSEVKFAGGSGSAEGGTGNFAWDAPDSFPDTATTQAVMVFDPEDPEYDNVEYDVTITVNKATLTPSVDTVEGKVYDGGTDTNGTIKLAGAKFTDVPAATGVFNFVDKNVAENKAVNVTAITLTDYWNDNYVLSTETLTAIPTTARITPKSVTLTWDGYRDLVYSGKSVNVTSTAGSLVEGDVCTVTVDDEGRATHAGAHTATATELSNSNYKLPDDVTQDYTIAPKPVTLLWHNMIQPYNGTDRAPRAVTGVGTESAVTIQNVVPEDNGTADVVFTVTRNGKSAQAVNAGTYMVSGAMKPGSNYVVTGHNSSQLTVQKAPVTFTVTDNTLKEGENRHGATVTPSPAVVPFTVTYKDRKGEVVDPETEDLKAGTYPIWASIADDNYHHVNAATGDAAQVGVFTVYAKDPPPKYAVKFDSDDPEDEPGADGSVIGTLTGTMAPLDAAGEGTLRVLPPCAFTCTGYAFAGWELDEQIYPAGATYTQQNREVTFTARWVKTVHTVEGVVDQDGKPVSDVQVTLMLGSYVVAQQHTDAAGKFRFENIAPGLYNLVVTKDGVTKTVAVTIVDQDEARNITLPTHKTNSVVVVVPGTPNVVVGNLENNFTPEDKDLAAENVSTEVEYKFTVRQEPENEQSTDQQAIREAAKGATPTLFLELKLEKTVTEGNSVTTNAMAESSVLIESVIPLPTQLQNKNSYSVIRCHGEGEAAEAQTLTGTPNDDGEYFTVNEEKTVLTIYARKFSTYSVAYTDRLPDTVSPTYSPIVAPTEHGTVTTSPARPKKGDEVTVTVKPDEGYEVDTVTVTDRSGKPVEIKRSADGTFTFTQPRGKVTVSATLKAASTACTRDATCPIAEFHDAEPTEWYHDGVHYCLASALMNGYGNGSFGPGDPLSRAMLAQILYNRAGKPEVSGAGDFPDLVPGKWYLDAVNWAEEKGIVTGYGNGSFGPDDPITREQLAVMLWRYAKATDRDVSIGEDTNILSYTDFDRISEWAIPALQWAAGSGVVQGKGDGVLDPKGQATRAEAAAMIQRFFTIHEDKIVD